MNEYKDDSNLQPRRNIVDYHLLEKKGVPIVMEPPPYMPYAPGAENIVSPQTTVQQIGSIPTSFHRPGYDQSPFQPPPTTFEPVFGQLPFQPPSTAFQPPQSSAQQLGLGQPPSNTHQQSVFSQSPPIQQSESVPPPKIVSKQQRRRAIYISIAILVALGIVLAITLSLVLSRKGRSTTSVNTNSPSAGAATSSGGTIRPTPTSFGPLDSATLLAFPSPLPQPTSSLRSWGPEQAIGAPNTFTYGDVATAWATRRADGPPEWLLLDYDTPVNPTRIVVYETYNPGAVVAVWVLPPGSGASSVNEAQLYWSGPVRTNVTSAINVFQIVTTNSAIGSQFVTSRVLLILDNMVNGWNEIDAVGLVDQSGVTRWALSAAASSSYAGGNYF